MARGEYSRSTWYGANSNNYSAANRPGSNPINKIVIHVTQGSWSSAINWFKDPRAGVSAHYTVRSRDGFIGQSLREKDIGYHAGNWNYNQTSIGIEHEGYISNPEWLTDTMYRSSAKLSAYLIRKYKIPIDRRHIVGHIEVPNSTHTDPGRYWDWNKYMRYVRQYAGGGPSYSQIVNNRNKRRFTAGRGWEISSYSSQSYGKDYVYTTPKSSTRYAWFKTKVPSRGNYAVYAWWPANSGYSGQAVYHIRTSGGWKGRAVNQRANGGRWNYLGTFTMAAGDNWWIRVINRSTSKGYIVADAVKIVKK